MNDIIILNYLTKLTYSTISTYYLYIKLTIYVNDETAFLIAINF